MRLSRTHSLNTKGPVPTGLEEKSWPASIRLLGRTAPQPEASAANSGEKGLASLKTTVEGSGVSTEGIAAYSLALGEANSLFLIRSKVASTSAEIGRASCRERV